MSTWNARRHPEPPHPFPHSIAGDEWVILSGVAGFDPQTATLSDDVAEQTRAVIDNAAWALEAAGSSWDEVVYIKPHFSSHEAILEADPVIRELLPEPRPASGGVIVCGLASDAIKVEFDVWAHRGARRRQAD